MKWTISLMLAWMLTTFSGSVMFVGWFGIGKLLERVGFTNIMYELLKMVVLFWYVPISYLALSYNNSSSQRWGGFLFKDTPFLHRLSGIFCLVWSAGIVLLLGKYIWDNIRLFNRYKNTVPCDGPEFDCFCDICGRLKIADGKVDLVQDFREQVPKIEGIFKTKIILPPREFTEEDLLVIFTHELTHYRQRDLWLKHCTAITKSLHWCNPIFWIFEKQVHKWGEYACDYEAVQKIGMNRGMKFYFGVIAKMAIEQSVVEVLEAQLVERVSDLEDRMLRMKRSYDKMKFNKKYSKRVTAVIVAALTIFSTSTIYAGTVSVGDMYLNTYNESVVEFDEVSDSSVEKTASGLEEGFIEEIGESFLKDKSIGIYNFNWTILVKGSKKTEDFTAKAGDAIGVTAKFTPSNAKVRIGIVQPDGTRRYVEGTGTLGHSFTLTQTGLHSVYVQNLSGGTITAGGSYVK